MRYLSLALFAEGPSDHVFLQRVIYRVVHEQAFSATSEPVEIAEQFVRPASSRRLPSSRAARAAAMFKSAIAQQAITLLFVHADADDDLQAAISQRIDPVRKEIDPAEPRAFQSVGIVPVRMTEAWALADADALRAEWGTTLSAASLGIPLTGDIESLGDPKIALRDAGRKAVGGRRRPRRRDLNQSIIPPGLGDRISLQAMRQLSAFRTFESDVGIALATLWSN